MIAGTRATAAQRAAVLTMSEEDVKCAFAEILGEPYVPRDWGGETSDLITSRMSIGGEPVAAASAFRARSPRPAAPRRDGQTRRPSRPPRR